MANFVIALGGADHPPTKIVSEPYNSLEQAMENCPPGRGIYDLTTGKWLNMASYSQGQIEWITPD